VVAGGHYSSSITGEPREFTTINCRCINFYRDKSVADPKNLKRGAEDNLSALFSFIANANNEIYAFYTEKAAF